MMEIWILYATSYGDYPENHIAGAYSSKEQMESLNPALVFDYDEENKKYAYAHRRKYRKPKWAHRDSYTAELIELDIEANLLADRW